MQAKYRVGIIGAGIGRIHVAAFQELEEWFEVVRICDIDEAKAQKLASMCGAQATKDAEEIITPDNIDIVDICTPSFLHVEQTLAALAAGKNVILEKPAAGSLRDIDELIAAGRSSGKWVMPVFQQRFGGGVQKLKFLQSRGITGQAFLGVAETAWRRRADYYATWHGQWKTELGGPLVTLGIHAHDVAMYVLGPAKRVMAQIATLVNPVETEDCATISLQMEDGSLASFAVTTGCQRQITRHHFCFRNLSAESNLVPYGNTADPWTFSGDTPELDEQIQRALAEYQPLPQGMTGQFYRCYQALQQGSELPVTLQDARRAIELISAVYYSARNGQAVDLPLGVDHPYYNGWF